MAKAFGIFNTAMSLYLTGKRTPKVEMLAKIVIGAQKMGLNWVTMDWLVFGEALLSDNKVVEGNMVDRKYDLLTRKIMDIVQNPVAEKKNDT